MAQEYIYKGIEIDEKDPKLFADKIQKEVEQLGGEVMYPRRDGHPEHGMAKLLISFQSRHNLEAWIRIYYAQGDLDPERIEEEVALIEEA